jgi:hypothetical protein
LAVLRSHVLEHFIGEQRFHAHENDSYNMLDPNGVKALMLNQIEGILQLADRFR